MFKLENMVGRSNRWFFYLYVYYFKYSRNIRTYIVLKNKEKDRKATEEEKKKNDDNDEYEKYDDHHLLLNE